MRCAVASPKPWSPLKVNTNELSLRLLFCTVDAPAADVARGESLDRLPEPVLFLLLLLLLLGLLLLLLPYSMLLRPLIEASNGSGSTCSVRRVTYQYCCVSKANGCDMLRR
jgi:hypothetical protein